VLDRKPDMVTIAGVLLGLFGLPVLAIIGCGVAVLGVWLLSKAMSSGAAVRVSAWETVSRLLRPSGSLARALLPLLLAIVVVCFFASTQFGPTLQIASGVALAGLAWLLVHGQTADIGFENKQMRDVLSALSPTTPYPRKLLRTLGLPLLIAAAAIAVFVVLGLGPGLGSWKSSGGWSGIGEYLGLITLGAAAVLRVFGYATSVIRGIVAVALALLAIRASTWAGLLRGEHVWRTLHLSARWTAFVLLSIVVLAFAIESWKLRGSPAQPPGETYRHGRGLGLLGAWISGALLAVALAVASAQTTGGADRLGSDRFGPITPTLAAQVLSTPRGPDADLAWTFAPALHLQHDEQYPPIAVNSFLVGSTESGAKPIRAGTALSLKTLPVECADGSNDPCGTISCPGCADRIRTTQPTGFVPQGVFYARVVHREKQPRVFKGWNPWGDQLATLIQYWLFYGYDRWQTETVIGGLTQEHQADWEHVSVGLDTQSRPLFVALSAHCGGQIVSWNKIAAAPGTLANGKVVIRPARLTARDEVTHPIVAVAKGSHANYAVSSGHRPPDWGSCKNLPSDALSALSYASNVRDLTEDGDQGWFAYPRNISVVTEHTRPMSYPGAWGSGETITFGHRKPTATSRGPLSPPLQRTSWDRPIWLYFCGSHWHGDIHGAAEDCR
jgi:hypothetical protein